MWIHLFHRYTKRYYENGTNEHSVSIGQAQVDNLLPDDRYRTILMSNCQQQQTMIRVYCKEGESVGGIAVKEHLGEHDLNRINGSLWTEQDLSPF